MGLFDNIQLSGLTVDDAVDAGSRTKSLEELIAEGNKAKGKTEFTPDLTVGRLGGAVVEELKMGVRDRLVAVGLVDQNVEDRAREHRTQRLTEIKSLQKRLGQDKQISRDEERVAYKGAAEDILAFAASERLAADPDFEVSSGFIEDQVRTLTQVGQQIVTAAVAGPIVSISDMGLMITGGTYTRLIAEGAEPERAKTAAFANAIMQSPIEYIGIRKVTKLFKSQKRAVKFLKEIGEIAGVEGLTEYIQNIGPEEMTAIWALNPDKSAKEMLGVWEDRIKTWETQKQALKGAGHAALASAILGSGPAAVRTRSEQPAPVSEPGKVTDVVGDQSKIDIVEAARVKESIQSEHEKRRLERKKAKAKARKEKPVEKSKPVKETIEDVQKDFDTKRKDLKIDALGEEGTTLPPGKVQITLPEVENTTIEVDRDIGKEELEKKIADKKEQFVKTEETPPVKKAPKVTKLTTVGILVDGKVEEAIQLPKIKGKTTHTAKQRKEISDSVAKLRKEHGPDAEIVFTNKEGEPFSQEQVAETLGTEEVLAEPEGAGGKFRGKKGEAAEKAFEKKKAKTNKKLLEEAALAKPLDPKQDAEFKRLMTSVRGAARRMSKANQADFGDLVNTAAIDVLKRVQKGTKKGEKFSPKFTVINAFNTIRARGMGSRRAAGKIKEQQFKEEKVAGIQDIEQAEEGTMTAPAEEVRVKSAIENLAKKKDMSIETLEDDVAKEASEIVGEDINFTKAVDILAGGLDAYSGKELTGLLALRKKVTGSIVPSEGIDTSKLTPEKRKEALAEFERVRAEEKARDKALQEEGVAPSKPKIIKTEKPQATAPDTRVSIAAEGTTKGVPFKSEGAADRALAVRKVKDNNRYANATVEKHPTLPKWNIIVREETTRERVEVPEPVVSELIGVPQGKIKKGKEGPPAQAGALTVGTFIEERTGARTVSTIEKGQRQILPKVGKTVEQGPRKRVTVDQAIDTIDESRRQHDLDIEQALSLKPGTPQYRAKLDAMAERVATRQTQIKHLAKQNATKAQKRKLKEEKKRAKTASEELVALGLTSPGSIVNNERGGMDVRLPGREGIISLPKRAGEVWTNMVDKALAKGGEAIRKLASIQGSKSSSGFDSLMTAFVEKFKIDKSFDALRQQKDLELHRMKMTATQLKTAIDKIDSTFKGKDFLAGKKGDQLKAAKRALDRRKRQVAEGSITAFPEKYAAVRLASQEFARLEQQLRDRGLLNDHQFKQLNRRERNAAVENIRKLESVIAEIKLSDLNPKNLKALKKTEKEREDTIVRLQIHYKNSGVNYLRHIKDQIDQVERYKKQFTMDAMSKKWSKRRRNWRVKVIKGENGKDIVTVRRTAGKKLKETSTLVAKGLGQEAHDLHMHDLFTSIANSEEKFVFDGNNPNVAPWAVENPDKYKNTGVQYKKMPKNQTHFGPLAGKYIEKHIFADMQNSFEDISRAKKNMREAFSNWKMGKTVYNPATQVRNFLSNIALAHVVGNVNVWNPKTYKQYTQAYKDAAIIKSGEIPTSKYGKELLNDTTIFSKSFTQAEIGGYRDYIQEGIKVMEKLNPHKGMASMLSRFSNYKGTDETFFPYMYDMMETSMKSLVYTQARERGMDKTDAASLANEALFDYSSVPSAIRWARRYYSPFVTFTYKAAPAVAKAIVRKPWKLVPYYAGVLAAEELSQYFLGDDDDDLEAKRRLLADYMDRDMLPGMPSHVRMPFTTPDGREKFLDLSFILPWGDLSAMGEGPLSWVPDALLPNTPVLTVPASLLTNVDLFTGKPITLEMDTAGQKIWKLFSKVATEVAPGIVSPLKMQKTVGAFYGDKNIMGDAKYSVGDAVLDWFLGVKLRNVDYMEQSFWRHKDLQNKAKELKIEMTRRYNDVANRKAARYTDKEREEAINDIMLEYNEKTERIIEEYHNRFTEDNDNE